MLCGIYKRVLTIIVTSNTHLPNFLGEVHLQEMWNV